MKTLTLFETIPTKGAVTRGNFFQQPATQRRCETSCGRNCACNTPSSQLVSQRKIASRVAGKLNKSSTFRSVARSVVACNMSSATCLAMPSSSLRCKLQEKLPRVTALLGTRISSSEKFTMSLDHLSLRRHIDFSSLKPSK